MTTSRLARFDALALTALVWFLGKFLRYAFPPLFGTLEGTYGVSRTALGTAFTGFMVVYAALQFPSGALADRIGGVRVIAAGGVVTAVGALVLVFDSPFVVLAGAMVLMGAGTGTTKTVAVDLLSRIYPARTGRALGVFDTIGAMAGAAAPAAVVLASGAPALLGAPWRTFFLVGGLATLAVTVAFAVRVPRRLPDSSMSAVDGDGVDEDSADGEGTDGDSVDGDAANGDTTDQDAADPASTDGGASAYLGLLRQPRFATFVAVTVLFSFAYNGAVAFLPLYLAEETALSAVTANLLFSALFLVSLVQLATGEASDRIGPLPVLALTLSVATAGLVAILALSGTGGPFVLGGAVVALGLGAHGYRPVRGAYLMAVVPESVAGGGLGVVRTLLMTAGAASPAIVGYLSETAGFGPAFVMLAVAMAGAAVLTLVLWTLDR
jgi:MFS family permease